MGKIRVSEKALAHLSRGLYRSPASALRELVSNAWDANAKLVRISTNFPLFQEVSVEDNGDGFTKEQFQKLMSGGIGNSEKRPIARDLINDRPIIGRLGIGMLGIAQICGSFTITSKQKSGEAFRARVSLYDLLKERVDKQDKDVVVLDSEIEGKAERIKEVDVGEYTFEDFDSERVRFGTSIVADDVHPMFVSAFKQSLEFEKFKQPPTDWAKALHTVSNVRSLQELGDYWRLLWELAAACPVPYINKRAVPRGLVSGDQDRLQSYDFKVIVDGIQLFKPLQLKANPGGYGTYRIDTVSQRVYSKDLVFHGYVVVQEGLQLRPDELRGILIRIRNVAVGYYDPSMLDYRYNEGPRTRWVTGEIYVEEGLEDALNIDRDSFNRFHPEFRMIQDYLHKLLHEEVFPATYEGIEDRSNEKAKRVYRRRTSNLKATISEKLNKKVAIRYLESESEALDLAAISISEKKNRVDIVIPLPSGIKTKKSNRQLASALLAIHEVSLLEKTKEKQKERFSELLLDLLARW